MVEYVIVEYPADRPVFVDGEENGPTNAVLRIDAGTHRFNLGEPLDYKPKNRKVVLEDTTVLDPRKVKFKPTEPA